MSALKEIEKIITEDIKSIGYDIDKTNLTVSNRPDLGDYQINDAMTLAKIYHENPRDIAEKIVKKIETNPDFKDINIAGPGFINFSLTDNYLIKYINNIHSDIHNNIDKRPRKKVVMDYGGANVAKALHVGHLRSANIGEALKRLAKVLGYEIISDAHLGDYGRPLGLVILEIKKMYPDLEFFNESYTGDYSKLDLPITNNDLEEIYPKASLKAKENEDYLEEARKITLKLQNKVPGYYDIWKKIIDISKKEIKKTYDLINVFYDLWEGESDSSSYIPRVIDIFTEKKLLKISDGAKIIDVKTEEDNSPMPPLLLVKSNDTVSYETTDIATILERVEKFNPDEIWYLTDGRQALHFEQVFRASRLAKLVNDNVNLEYISFGTMNGKDGKPFKTRDGGVMTLKGLIELINKETSKRINTKMVSSENLEKTSLDIAISALKYTDLLPFRGTDYIFDPEKFADLEGKTGPYLLYSTVRMSSLLIKADLKGLTALKINSKTDRDIYLLLLQLPEILNKSLDVKSLNDIAEYIYKLTALYNKFYAENKILTNQDEELKNSWITLTETVYKTNMLILDILGLKVPEKM